MDPDRIGAITVIGTLLVVLVCSYLFNGRTTIKVWEAIDEANRNGEPIWGGLICERTGLRISTVFAALDDLVEDHSITWYDEGKKDGKPARRYYQTVEYPC